MRFAIVFTLLFAGCASYERLAQLGDPKMHNCVSGFASGGRVAYLTRSSPDFATSDIYVTKRGLWSWSTPVRASFSNGLESGAAGVFTSRRKHPTLPDSWNLWRETGPLPEPINSSHADCCPAPGPNGELYFSSTRSGSWDIYVAHADGRVEKLAGTTNVGAEGAPDESGRDGEWPSYVDPRLRYLLFSSIRAGGKGGDDIYVATHSNGVWSAAQNLGDAVNDGGYQDCATVTPDGATLLWSSRGTGRGSLSQIRVLPVSLTPLPR